MYKNKLIERLSVGLNDFSEEDSSEKKAIKKINEIDENVFQYLHDKFGFIIELYLETNRGYHFSGRLLGEDVEYILMEEDRDGEKIDFLYIYHDLVYGEDKCVKCNKNYIGGVNLKEKDSFRIVRSLVSPNYKDFLLERRFGTPLYWVDAYLYDEDLNKENNMKLMRNLSHLLFRVQQVSIETLYKNGVYLCSHDIEKSTIDNHIIKGLVEKNGERESINIRIKKEKGIVSIEI